MGPGQGQGQALLSGRGEAGGASRPGRYSPFFPSKDCPEALPEAVPRGVGNCCVKFLHVSSSSSL